MPHGPIARTLAWCCIAVAVAGASGARAAPAADGAAPPARLSETGLYVAGSTDVPGPGVLAFSPQYPLWSDGATKRRWIRLPAGAAIDAARVDAWEFPPGTRLWKEFSHGRRVETRMIERLADGSWRFAAYVWQPDGRDALLVPGGGASVPAPGAPGGRYTVPSEGDCRACHEGAAVPVLGFSALQLSPDRDPLAPHAERAGGEDLRSLVAKGLLVGLPAKHLVSPPRIAARSPVERAALGYLHANCGHCHNDPRQSGAGVPVDLLLAQSVGEPGAADAVRRSVLGARTTRFQRAGAAPTSVAELLPERLRSRDPRTQMPPLGTSLPDEAAVRLIERWLANATTASNPTHPKE